MCCLPTSEGSSVWMWSAGDVDVRECGYGQVCVYVYDKGYIEGWKDGRKCMYVYDRNKAQWTRSTSPTYLPT